MFQKVSIQDRSSSKAVTAYSLLNSRHRPKCKWAFLIHVNGCKIDRVKLIFGICAYVFLSAGVTKRRLLWPRETRLLVGYCQASLLLRLTPDA